MPRLRWPALAAALVVVPLGQAHAQRPAARSTTWATFGIGLATWGGLTEVGWQFSASHQTRRIVMSARAVFGFDLLGVFVGSSGTVIDVQDFGLTLGVGSRPGLIRYSIGAGVGMATVQRRGTGSTNPRTSVVGVPLEAQFFVQPIRFLGVGLYGYGDLNKERSFWGGSISVALGRLR